MAAELAALGPDVIVTGTAPVLAAAHGRTKTIPIVFMQVTDPVSDGFVASLARPGGNVTGFTIFEHSFAGKWVEMLKEVVPTMTRVAVMQNPDHPAWNAYVRAIREVAPGMGLEVTPAPARRPDEIEAALAAFAQTPNGGVILLPSPLVTTNRELIAASTLRHRLPSIYVVRIYPASGGLMSYGLDSSAQIREAADYVNRILKGAKPGRTAGAGGEQVRDGDQPQDREGAWHHRARDHARPRRRGDRVTARGGRPTSSRPALRRTGGPARSRPGSDSRRHCC